jgi:hypothetical protein
MLSNKSEVARGTEAFKQTCPAEQQLDCGKVTYTTIEKNSNLARLGLSDALLSSQRFSRRLPEKSDSVMSTFLALELLSTLNYSITSKVHKETSNSRLGISADSKAFDSSNAFAQRSSASDPDSSASYAGAFPLFLVGAAVGT